MSCLCMLLFFLIYTILMSSRTVQSFPLSTAYSYPVSTENSYPVSSLIQFIDQEDYEHLPDYIFNFCRDMRKKMEIYVPIGNQTDKVIGDLEHLFNEKYYDGINFPSTYDPHKSVILTRDEVRKYNRRYCGIRFIPQSEWIFIYSLITVLIGLLMVILFCWKL